jgi:integrase
MDRMRPPSVPEQPVPVLTDEQLRLLLASSDGQDFVDRRDTAIIRLFMDTSCRRAEIAGLTTADVSLGTQIGRTSCHIGPRLWLTQRRILPFLHSWSV